MVVQHYIDYDSLWQSLLGIHRIRIFEFDWHRTRSDSGSIEFGTGQFGFGWIRIRLDSDLNGFGSDRIRIRSGSDSVGFGFD